MGAKIIIGGHTFTLKHIKYGIHSEETTDYMAELFCDGKRIAFVENDGHGGQAVAHWDRENIDFAREMEMAVRKEVWLTCEDGTKIYYNLGQLADELEFKTAKHKAVTKMQVRSIVVEREDEELLYQMMLASPVVDVVDNDPDLIVAKIKKLTADGWTVLNTNIPKRLFKAAGVR